MMEVFFSMEQWLSANFSYSALIGIIVVSTLGLVLWALVLVRTDDFSK